MRKQKSFNFKKYPSAHGGSLTNPQKRKRPLALRTRNHFVMRSSKAVKQWSFRRHKFVISAIIKKFAQRHHIGLVSMANVGNHLHLSLEISNRKQYRKFIRAICSAIMMQVTGYNRWNKAPEGFQFWDARPFSRIVSTWKEIQNLDRYLSKNRWQALGASRSEAQDLARIGWFLSKNGAVNSTHSV